MHLIKRMESLGIIWGEENTPGLTWLKERVVSYTASAKNTSEGAQSAGE